MTIDLEKKFRKTIIEFLRRVDLHNKETDDWGQTHVHSLFDPREFGLTSKECLELVRLGVLERYHNHANLHQIYLSEELRKEIRQKMNAKFRRRGFKELRCVP